MILFNQQHAPRRDGGRESQLKTKIDDLEHEKSELVNKLRQTQAELLLEKEKTLPSGDNQHNKDKVSL